ncbi:MAG: hypothetical protein WDA27_12125 [Actinomycetota bacterium]
MSKLAGGAVLYGSVVLSFFALVLWPVFHALRRGRWVWVFLVCVFLHVGGLAYWIRHALTRRPA